LFRNSEEVLKMCDIQKDKIPFVYEDCFLGQISFPIGGIGTGSIGLAGNGRLVDWEIFNRPNKNGYNGSSFFAIKIEHEDIVLSARVLNGDLHTPYIGQGEEDNRLGTGVNRETMSGFPHFEKAIFTGKFPVAEIDFFDNDIPLDIKMTAFNPFIPLNDRDSSIPAAIYSFNVRNITDLKLNVTIMANVFNPHKLQSVNRYYDNGHSRGITFTSLKYGEDDPKYGDISISTDCKDVSRQTYLYRGRWFDSLTMLWKDFSRPGPLQDRIYDLPHNDENENLAFNFSDAGALAGKLCLEPGESKQIRFVLSWYFPNAENYWNPGNDRDEKGAPVFPKWKNYYANLYSSSPDVADYIWNNYDRLYEETAKFRDLLFETTLPDYVLDAVSANISILKTPTCLRLPDGTLYGFEGCHAHSGSCEGSCTHVWNYDQATPFLFPALARSMHDIYYKYNQYESGKMLFRMMMPPEKTKIIFSKNNGPTRAAADGQMGEIMRIYREWKISGDSEWLKEIWPKAKKALEYAWSSENEYHWDENCDGIMEGAQHNTLDVELFGPNAFISGMYQGALLAAYEMGKALGDPDHEKYLEIFNKGNRILNDRLFNGEYYYQAIDFRNDDRFPIDQELGEIKNQIAEGCFVDQTLAQWHASLYGLGRIFDADKHQTALKSIYRYNFINHRNHVNPCRIYALNDEWGVVLCTWPKGNSPKIPAPYSTECWTGMEYDYACRLIQEGMIEKGLDYVKIVRDRFDGKKRNPWSEFEAGNNYARSMASYSLLPALSGFRFDMTKGFIGFDPRINQDSFKCFWSCGSAWGQYCQDESRASLEVCYGRIVLNSLGLPPMLVKKATEVKINGKKVEFIPREDRLEFGNHVYLKKGDILKVN